MRGIWMSNPAGNTWPLWDLIRNLGCNRIYFMAMVAVFENGHLVRFDPNTRQINNAYRAAVAAEMHHNQYAIARVPHWDNTPYTTAGAIELAQKAHDDLNKATDNNKLIAAPYMFDIEYPYKDSDWLLTCFKEFRRLRPTRLVSWTMEPWQGGNISPKLAQWINSDINMVLVPQTFGPQMEPWPREQVRQNIIGAGVRPARVRMFLDASKPRPAGWDGCLFHMENAVV